MGSLRSPENRGKFSFLPRGAQLIDCLSPDVPKGPG